MKGGCDVLTDRGSCLGIAAFFLGMLLAWWED
jgi:hypothetical protein